MVEQSSTLFTAMLACLSNWRSVRMALLTMRSFRMGLSPLLSSGGLETLATRSEATIRPVGHKVRATKFMAVNTVGFTSVPRGPVITPQCIHTGRNSLDVNGIDTGSIPTEVVSLVTGRFDNLNKPLKSNTVCVSIVTRKKELGIAVKQSSSPNPASGLLVGYSRVDPDLTEEAGKEFTGYWNAVRIILDHLSLLHRFNGSRVQRFAPLCPSFYHTMTEAT